MQFRLPAEVTDITDVGVIADKMQAETVHIPRAVGLWLSPAMVGGKQLLNGFIRPQYWATALPPLPISSGLKALPAHGKVVAPHTTYSLVVHDELSGQLYGFGGPAD